MDAYASLRLDSGTLLFSMSMFGFLMSGMSWSSARAMPDQRPALIEWSRAMLAVAGSGFLLFFLRGFVPWRINFIAANVLLVLMTALGHFAFTRLLDIRPRRPLVVLAVLFAFSGVFMAYALDAPWNAAVFTLSIGASAIPALTAYAVGGDLQGRTLPAARIASVFFGLMSAIFLVRALISVLGGISLIESMSGSAAQVGSLLLACVCIVATSVAFFALAHERQRQATIDNSRRDGLTGVHTRASFFELAAEVDKASAQAPYAIVMIDIDFFKKVNDEYGHGGGDYTLSHAARLIAGSVRISDLVGRYGGEEFCVLLRECNELQAATLAQRLVMEASRQSVRLPDGRRVRYTLSAGYAIVQTQPEAGGRQEPLGAVIERADQALYRAKREGRNRALPAKSRSEPAAV